MSSGRELEQQLNEIGSKLLASPSSVVDELLSLLDHAEIFLSRIEQSPAKSMRDALSPLTQALVSVELLRHSNVDVKVAVASCISEITRITAPDAPYDDDKMKDIFQLIVSSFENLSDKSSRSYNKRVMILETVAKVRSCVVMLDLECDGLIAEMFQHFLSTIREYHSENIFVSMETIMTLVLEESEEISPELLAPMLACVKKDNQEVLSVAVKLVEKVFRNCAVQLKPYLSEIIKSLDAAIDDYSSTIASICCRDSSLNHNDENISNVPAVVEDNSAVTSTDEAQENQLVTKGALIGNATFSSSSSKVAEDAKNTFKEDVATPEVKVPSMTTLTKGADGIGNQMETTSTKMGSSVIADKQILDDPTSADKRTFKPEVDDLVAKNKSPRLESKPVSAAKKKVKKSKTQKTAPKSSDAAHYADENEVGGGPDQAKGDNTEAVNGPVKEDKAVQASSPMDDSAGNLHSPKTSDAEDVRTASPSPITGTLADEIRKKRSGRSKKKQKLVKEDSSLKIATKGTKELEAKPNKLKIPIADFVNEGKVNADVATSKSGGGSKSDSGLKPRAEIDKNREECSNADDVISSQRKKVGKNRSRDKVTSEDEKIKSNTKDNTKMINTPKSPEKSAKNEGVQDETTVPSTKRNRSISKDKKKASEIVEYGENLVGAKVKVYWPKDFAFYSGAVESFDPIKNKHTIKYDDGDIEILNLKRQRWEFVEDHPDSSEVQASEPVDKDRALEIPLLATGNYSHSLRRSRPSLEIRRSQPTFASPLGLKTVEFPLVWPKRKKSKTTAETSAMLGKTHEPSFKGGSVLSSKSKSGGKSNDDRKSKEESNERTKLKDKSSKPKSEDDTSIKSKENEGTTSSKSKSSKHKQESDKVAEKSKEEETLMTIGGSGGSKSKGKIASGGRVDPSSNNGSGKAKSKESGGGDTKEKRKEKSSKTPSEGTKVKFTVSDSKSHEESVDDAAAAAASTKKRRR